MGLMGEANANPPPVVGGKGGIGLIGEVNAKPPPVVGGKGGIGLIGEVNEMPPPVVGGNGGIGLMGDAIACERPRIAKIAPRTKTLRNLIELICIVYSSGKCSCETKTNLIV
jgi:hypothetical protein